MIVTVNYELEHYVEAADDYIYIDLECDVDICPAEPDVGIMQPYAEIQSTVDSDGKDWGDLLDARDNEIIELKALNGDLA
jgi:hypothetical protein